MNPLNLDQRLQSIEDSLFAIKLQSKEVFTPDEAAEYMGMKKSYLYKLTAARKIKYFQPLGKLIYLNKSDVIDFLNQNPITNTSSFEDEIVSKWK